MFDWIGDAIDWIGDGISSLWDSTIGGATEAIGDWIWETMFEWLFNLIRFGFDFFFLCLFLIPQCFIHRYSQCAICKVIQLICCDSCLFLCPCIVFQILHHICDFCAQIPVKYSASTAVTVGAV